MKPSRSIPLTLVVLGALAGLSAETATETLLGRIAAVERLPYTLELKSSDGLETFIVTPDTHISRGSQPIAFDQLSVGQQVEVEAHTASAATRLAVAVVVVDKLDLTDQLRAFPAVDAADTATVVRADVTAGELHVDTADGPRRYRVDAATRIRSATAELRLADLEPGQRVVVSARRNGAPYVAAEIVVVAVGPEPAPVEWKPEDEHDR